MEPAESAYYSFCDTHQIPTLVGTISSWFGFWRGAKQLASFIGDASFIDKAQVSTAHLDPVTSTDNGLRSDPTECKRQLAVTLSASTIQFPNPVQVYPDPAPAIAAVEPITKPASQRLAAKQTKAQAEAAQPVPTHSTTTTTTDPVRSAKPTRSRAPTPVAGAKGTTPGKSTTPTVPKDDAATIAELVPTVAELLEHKRCMVRHTGWDKLTPSQKKDSCCSVPQEFARHKQAIDIVDRDSKKHREETAEKLEQLESANAMLASEVEELKTQIISQLTDTAEKANGLRSEVTECKRQLAELTAQIEKDQKTTESAKRQRTEEPSVTPPNCALESTVQQILHLLKQLQQPVQQPQQPQQLQQQWATYQPPLSLNANPLAMQQQQHQFMQPPQSVQQPPSMQQQQPQLQQQLPHSPEMGSVQPYPTGYPPAGAVYQTTMQPGYENCGG